MSALFLVVAAVCVTPLTGRRASREVPAKRGGAGVAASELAEHVFSGAHLELAGRLDVELFDDAVVDDHRETLPALAEAAGGQVKLKPHGLGEIAVAVAQHGHVRAAVGLAPRAHHERVVDGGAGDLVDSLGLELRGVIDLITSGALSKGDGNLFRPLVEDLLGPDPFMLLADYPDYIACQEKVSKLWGLPAAWNRMSILNVARMGYFSSDRSIREYCEKIWQVKPVPVNDV